MLSKEITDALESEGIQISTVQPMQRRADPVDEAAGAHLAGQGAVSVYRADDLIIKVAPETKFSAYRQEARLLSYLREAAFPVPRVFIPPQLIGTTVFMATEYIAHNPLATPDPTQTGEHLAQLHTLAPPEWLGTDTTLQKKYNTLREAKKIGPQLMDFLQDNFVPILEAVSEGNTNASKICHGDLHLGNILPSASGIRLIDFESAAAGHPLWDVARLAQIHAKYGMRGNWYERCWDAWSSATGYIIEELRPYEKLRSWYGVIDLLGRTSLSEMENKELHQRLNWAHGIESVRWTRI